MGKLRQRVPAGGHERGETPIDHHRHDIGAGEQVAELVGDIAVVDVDPHRPQLEDGPERLDPFDPVVGVDADVVAGTDPDGGEVMGELVRPLLHLEVRAPDAVGDQVLTLAEDVDGMLEQVGQVVLHRR